MYRLLIFLCLLIVGCSDISESGSGNSSVFSGFLPPVLSGDIAENPVKAVNSSLNSDYYNFDSAGNINFNISFSSITSRPSYYEVIIPHTDYMPVTSTCMNNIPFGSCYVGISFNPNCNGVKTSYIKISADNVSKTFSFTGEGSGFDNNCGSLVNNINMTGSISSHTFNYIGETVEFTVSPDNTSLDFMPYETGGVKNGFYYYYKCFDNSKNCSGKIMFLGKMGKYDCYGEAKTVLEIYSDPFLKNGSPASISLYGTGLGRDSRYLCSMVK